MNVIMELVIMEHTNLLLAEIRDEVYSLKQKVWS